MSRFLKNKIKIKDGVKVEVSDKSATFSSSDGRKLLKVPFYPYINIDIIDNKEILISKTKEEYKSYAGTLYKKISNAINDISGDFTVSLEIFGVGSKVELNGNFLFLSLGYSHPVAVFIPEFIKVQIIKDTTFSISGFDREFVSNFASLIIHLKKTEPYKGKGIRYLGQVIKTKVGKKN